MSWSKPCFSLVVNGLKSMRNGRLEPICIVCGVSVRDDSGLPALVDDPEADGLSRKAAQKAIAALGSVLNHWSWRR